MSLDDLYNHLKVYESEVQKKTGSSSQNLAFISSSNTSSGKSEVSTAQATQQSGFQIKYEDIIQIDDDDIEEMDIKWKKTGKKTTIQGSDVAGFDKSKVECFNCHKMRHFARECRAPMSQDKSKRESYKKDPKVEEPSHKAMMAIDGIGWDWSFMAKKMKLPKESFLIRVLERDLELKDYKIENLTNELEEVKKERDGIDSKLEKFVHASKDLDQMLENQKSGKDKKGVGFDEYSVVPPPPAQIYSPPKLDLSWTGLPKFADDNVTDYTRPTPSVDVTNNELDGNNMSIYEHGGTSSNVVSKHVINFIKGTSTPNVTKVYNTKNIRKPPSVKYAEMYKNTSKSLRVRGNQRNWNNLKSQQLGKDFVMQNKACFKCGCFDHLAANCGIWEEKEVTWPRNNYKNMTPRAVLLKSGLKPTAPIRPVSTDKPTLNVAQPKKTSFAKTLHSNVERPFVRKYAAKKVWVPKVPTVSTKVPTVCKKVPTVGFKVPTAKPIVAANLGNKGKAVKALARWI
ncbi:ribonuclease H-like domain-containing protein [Tanacetum coccineum]